GIRDRNVTGVQTCALPIWGGGAVRRRGSAAGSADQPHLGQVEPLVAEARPVGEEAAALVEPPRARVLLGDPELGRGTGRQDRLRSEERRGGREWWAGGGGW